MKILPAILLCLSLLLSADALAAESAAGRYFIESDQAARNGNWPEAEILLQKAVMLESNNEAYLLRLAEIKAHRKDFNGARSLLAALEKKNPDSVLLQCKKAVILALSGDAAGAAALARSISTDAKKDDIQCSARLETAEALWASDLRMEALKLLSEANSATGQEAEIEAARTRMIVEFFEEGRRLLFAGNTEKAFEIWKFLTEVDPLNAELADFACGSGQDRNILETLRNLLRDSIKTTDIAAVSSLVKLARTWRCIGDKAQARAALELADEATKQKSDWVIENAALSIEDKQVLLEEVFKPLNLHDLATDDWLLLAQAAERGRGGAEAAEILEKAFDAGASDRQLFARMERIYSMNTDLPFKEDWLKRAENLFPNDAGIQIIIGQAYFMREMNERALPYFERAFKIIPHASNLLGMIAAVYHDLENKESISRDLERRIQADPRDPVPRMALGVIAYYSGDYARAIELLEPLQKEFPEEPRVWIYSMMSYFHMGKQAEAERLLERIYSMNDADVYYCAGVIYEKSNPRRAVREIERFLSMAEYLPKRHISKIARVRKFREELLARIDGKDESTFDLSQLDWRRWAVNSAIVIAIFAILIFVIGKQRRK